MKKFLLSLGLACVTAVAQAGSFEVICGKDGTTPQWPNMGGYAQTEVSTAQFGGCTWSAQNMNNNNNGWAYLRLGKKSTTNGIAALYSNAALPWAVTDVTLTVKEFLRGTVNSATLVVSDDDSFADATSVSYNVSSAITAAGDYTFTVTTPVAGKYYKLLFNTTNTTSKNGVIDITKVVFNYTEGEAKTVATPTLAMVEGDYSFSVTMTCETEGAEIRYTTDGTEPTAESTLYSAPVEVWEATTFKAVGVKDGELSNVATFTANPPYILDGFDTLLGFENVPAEGVPVVVKAPMTAIYQNGSNLYVKSGSSCMLIFGNIGKTLSNGDTFNRIAGTYKLYQDQPEIEASEVGEVTAGTPVQPQPVELDMVNATMICQYVTVENVTIAKDESDSRGKTFTVTDASGNSVTMYNKFGLTIEPGTGYTVTGFVGKNNGTIQLQPVEVTGGVVTIPVPVFNPASGASVPYQSYIELTAEEGSEIYFKYDSDSFELYNADDKIMVFTAVGQTATIEAYAKKGDNQSETVTATYTVTKKDPMVRWLDANGEEVSEVEYVFGSEESFVPPMFDSQNTEAEPTMESSDPAVASINEMYGIDINAVGTTVITVTVPETANYAEGSASFILNVLSEPVNRPVTATFNFNDFESLTFETPVTLPASGNGVNVDSNKLMSDGVTLSFVKGGSNGVKYWNATSGTTLRVYSPSQLTLAVDAAYTITKVTFDSPGDWGLALGAEQPGTFSNKVWEKGETENENVASLTFNATAKTFLNRIEVVYEKIGTGIESVAVDDENAPVEYFNLQGVKVANPSAGIYIRRQGSKATKVLVK